MTWSNIGLIAIVAAIAVVLTACGISKKQAADLAVAANQAAAIKQQWEQVESSYQEHADKLQADRRAKADKAMQKLGSVIEGVDPDDPRAILKNVDQAKAMYRQARSAYETLRPIAKELIDKGEIKGGDAAALTRFDERVRDLDRRIDDLGDASDAKALEILGVVRDVVPVIGRVVLSLA